MTTMKRTLSLLPAFLMLCGLAKGQSVQNFGAPALQIQAADAAQISTGNLGSDPVAAGDLVSVSVGGSAELSRSYRIDSGGQIVLPMLKAGVAVAGLTPPQVSQAVAAALISERILVGPIVSTTVLEYRSRMVSVVGAVKMPTVLQAIGNTNLLDALARAQGLAPEAGPEILVSRPRTGQASESMHIPVKALLAGNDPALNIPLFGGEEIRVPEAPKLYIMGNVRTPGVFPLTELDGSTVLKALALSQGTLSFTAKKAYVYRLAAGSKDRREIEIELFQILHRKAPDVPLEANDILYIPENSKKRLSASVIDHLSGFGASTASGLLVYH
jgi:polysaccharide export outer membrane protein